MTPAGRSSTRSETRRWVRFNPLRLLLVPEKKKLSLIFATLPGCDHQLLDVLGRQRAAQLTAVYPLLHHRLGSSFHCYESAQGSFLALGLWHVR